MAISFVGGLVGTHASTSAQTVNFSGLLDASGAAPTLRQNDVVIVTVFQAATATRTQAQLTPSGYTVAHGSVITASDTNISSEQTSYKIMGSTPDATVSIPASASTTAGVAYAIHVFRGVDVGTPMDVTATTASGINGAQPNPPAITPSTVGAWIYCVGGGAMAAGAAPQSTAPTGLDTTTNAWRQTVLTTTTNDPGLAAGFKSDWASGAFDCPALTGYTTTNTGSWTAAALALRPQAVTNSNGSSSGAATASGVGKETAKASGSAAGAASPSGSGRSVAKSSGAASASASVAGIGKTGMRSSGTALGSAVVAGSARMISTGAGSAIAAATVMAIGASRRVGNGASSALAAANGAGTAKVITSGTAVATASATGSARLLVRSAGSATGSSVVTAQGRSDAAVTGSTAGAAVAAGQSVNDNGPATGRSSGSSACSGRANAEASANGACSSSSISVGWGRCLSSGRGFLASIGTAAGVSDTKAPPAITPEKRRIANPVVARYAAGPHSEPRSITPNLQGRTARK